MKISIEQPLAIHELGNRTNQEDCVYPEMGQATITNRFFIVCDGMGGHEKGEVASELVCNTLAACLEDENTEHNIEKPFLEALDSVFDKLDEYDDDAYFKMGTTLTFLGFYRGGAMMAHIGDSRIYHIRPLERKILYKSRDHSLVYDLFMAGEITQAEMATYPKKNVITSALMPHQEVRPKAAITHTADVKKDDYFLMCSDGLLEQMTDVELVNLLAQECSDGEKCKELVKRTQNNKDNHSAYLIRVANVLIEDGDSAFPDDEQSTPNNAIMIEKGAEQSVNIAQQRAKGGAWTKILILVLFFLVIVIFILFF